MINSYTCLTHQLRDNEILLIDDVSTFRFTIDARAIILKPVYITSTRGLVLTKGN
jgi:hypothetical protein